MSLSSLLKDTFNKYPLDHSLDKEQIKKFINACDPKVKNICKKIIKNTIHISFEVFLTFLNINIGDLLTFINPKRPVYILIDDLKDEYKFKSNYWLYIYVQNYIKSKTSINYKIILINDLEFKELKNGDLVVLIDDCVYSGLQMSETIRNLKNTNLIKLNIYLLIPFISNEGFSRIHKVIVNSPNIHKYCNVYLNKQYNEIIPIKNILTNDETKLMDIFYGNLQNFNYSYLIYFDHKLADTASTLTLFYLGIVPNKKNQLILEKLYEIVDYHIRNNIIFNYFKKYNDFINSHELDIIPIIKNCDKYTKNLDIWSSKCPYPPYKKGFFNFIKEIKKTKKIKSLSFNKPKYEKKIKSF
jgi:hypothetical protein